MTDLPHPPWRFEYLGPGIEFVVTDETEWNISFRLGNVGSTDESYVVLLHEQRIGGERIPSSVYTVPAQEMGGIGFGFFASEEVTTWWPRIYTTSRDLIPSMHFYVWAWAGPASELARESVPFRTSFYVSPNDFAVRELSPPLLHLPTPTPSGLDSADRAPMTVRWIPLGTQATR